MQESCTSRRSREGIVGGVQHGLGVCSSDGAIGSLSGNCIGSSGSGSGGMRGLGAGAMQSRDTEMQRAMQELQELQGMVASDDRDSWRFEQAARPATALRPTTCLLYTSDAADE